MFHATVSNHVWSKSILALSAISDVINFIILPDQLTISGLNNAQTNHGEITFKKSFFTTYDSTEPLSFKVSSSQLSIIFKNLDGSIALNVNGSKMFIDVNGAIIKKYQIPYNPINMTENPLNYKAEMDMTNSQVKHLTMDENTIKNFIDMIPPGTEEFKVDIKSDKISFNGYTKQIVKDNMYLRQPMLITISLAINELIDSNLDGTTASLNFKLKFFKLFINLVNLLKGEDFECYFKENEPVVFEYDSAMVEVKFSCLANDQGNLGIEYRNAAAETASIGFDLEESRSPRSPESPRSTRGEIDQLDIDFDDFDPDLGPTQTDAIKSIFD